MIQNGEVLHDYFAVREGGGKLALTLAAARRWPIVAGFVSPRLSVREEWPTVTLRELGVRPGVPPSRSVSLTRRWSKYRSGADALVYSGTYAPMAALNQRDAYNILYCHTPPRFIYDQKDFYLASLQVWQRPLFLALIRYLRPRYEAAVACMDRIIVNSENVRRRVQRHLGCSSTVVYPPCDVRRYRWQEPEGYYLSVARLDILKRVDRIVEAFKGLPDKKLVVVSDGAQRSRLESLAENSPNINFLGEISDERLRDLLGRCIGTIYVPRDEDFGMSPVESMAAGKPVVGVAEGGLLETLVDGETGYLLPPEFEVDDLVDAVSRLTAGRAEKMRAACEERARLFDTETFLQQMESVVNGR